ncbi:hypothetical protein MIMGU_mgv11b012604mg [Erythranthe guttata]|uniref:Uncharacterized protein n=1 Tax=Erythranthe guttata TaxID=4155 RepID=A0A022R5V7_ERYGU|nr:hypothetical protein MIMGU_mgv11b012604mg [Erythranthe guttata]
MTEDKAQHDNNASRSDKKQHMSQRFPSDEEPLHNHDKITRSKTLQFPTVELKTKKFESVLMHSGKVHNDAPKIEVIELLSDDESAISHNDDVADETCGEQRGFPSAATKPPRVRRRHEGGAVPESERLRLPETVQEQGSAIVTTLSSAVAPAKATAFAREDSRTSSAL